MWHELHPPSPLRSAARQRERPPQRSSGRSNTSSSASSTCRRVAGPHDPPARRARLAPGADPPARGGAPGLVCPGAARVFPPFVLRAALSHALSHAQRRRRRLLPSPPPLIITLRGNDATTFPALTTRTRTRKQPLRRPAPHPTRGRAATPADRQRRPLHRSTAAPRPASARNARRPRPTASPCNQPANHHELPARPHQPPALRRQAGDVRAVFFFRAAGGLDDERTQQ